MEKTENVMEKVMENHGIFCNLKSTNPVACYCSFYTQTSQNVSFFSDHDVNNIIIVIIIVYFLFVAFARV